MPAPRFQSPTLPKPMFQDPMLPSPRLGVTPWKNPATCDPMLDRPETNAGSARFSVEVLNQPETVLPRFAQPEASEP